HLGADPEHLGIGVAPCGEEDVGGVVEPHPGPAGHVDPSGSGCSPAPELSESSAPATSSACRAAGNRDRTICRLPPRSTRCTMGWGRSTATCWLPSSDLACPCRITYRGAGDAGTTRRTRRTIP